MRFLDIIEKKKDKKELTREEIQFWIDGVVREEIPEYQSSALLMAIVLNGMSERETVDLTMIMRDSGDVYDLSLIAGIKADKHSTGGVGDKTTLALGPLVASQGVKIAKMSGRGLGHTGGTLDKLESIPGYRIALSNQELIDQVNRIGIAVIGQSDTSVPADKKLYALRDVTATVESIPLIASSIMSKKLACGSDTILLDVKVGEGAFMANQEEAEILAKQMISIGRSLGKDVRAEISNMDQPLGFAIGNALEVIEAIDTLKGQGPKDFTDLCIYSGATILQQAKLCENHKEGEDLLRKAIEDGSALVKLKELISAQGGDPGVVDDPKRLPQAKSITPVYASREGWLNRVASRELGILAMELGAGRAKKEDPVNHAVGLVVPRKIGDFVKAGDLLCSIYHDQPLDEMWLSRLQAAFGYQDSACEALPLIYKTI